MMDSSLESVVTATTTFPQSLARRILSTMRLISGWPAKGSNTLPGKREEPMRACTTVRIFSVKEFKI
jgi:hypothetical protein